MEAKNFEGRQLWKEKANKDPVEVVEDDSDEEEAGGGLMLRFEENNNEKQNKKAVAAAAGRRGSGGGVAQPSCQAERCGADLGDAKRYHRRHKVCEFHSKAAVVMVSGLRQRFCQQCSRFHELTEFDEAKRSCRRRLAGHNERRRKCSGEPYGEGSSSSRGRGVGVGQQSRVGVAQAADDQRAVLRYQISPPGNSSKHFQMR